MEFHCRVATATGQIMEATYVAESEARLRTELEEKGLYLLSVQGRGRPRARRSPPRPADAPAKFRTPEFLVFNQELATLLKAGLPLVQSLDILRRRVPNPVVQGGARRHLRARCDRARRCRRRSRRSSLFSGVYTASLMAGEKSGSLEQVLRRYVQHIKVLRVGALARRLGADLSGRARRAVGRRSSA